MESHRPQQAYSKPERGGSLQPRPATPTVAFRRWGAEASRATRCHLSCPFTQTPLMERREDSPSSRNSHRLPGRDLDVPECAHHLSASTRAGLHTRAPLCVCIPGHACLSGSVRLGQARFYQAGRWAPPPRGLPGLDASQPGELCSAQRVGVHLETQRRDPCRELWAEGSLYLTVASTGEAEV